MAKNVLRIDLNSPEYSERFDSAPVYVKTAKVKAVVAIEPTAITTTLADGKVETTNIAQPGDYIITNPGGEQYIISAQKFAKRYRPTDEEGIYQAVGQIRAFKNPTGQPISIIAPWGEEQFGNEDCILAISLEVLTDRYIIGGAEFAQTYGTKDN